MSRHRDRIVDQFTRQALPFSVAPELRNEKALARIVEMAAAGPSDSVLDVACGPGILTCAFARVVRRVTGVDVTRRMLNRAVEMQREQGLENLCWLQSDALHLPFADAAFSVVSSRFAFHHLVEPIAVLREMRRVCRPQGRIVVADSSPAAEKADAFNRMERLRDPSHVRALPQEELVALFAAAGLASPRIRRDPLPYELESFLARSFPEAGDAERIRQLFAEALEDDRLGVTPTRAGDTIRFSFPTVIVAASVPGPSP